MKFNGVDYRKASLLALLPIAHISQAGAASVSLDWDQVADSRVDHYQIAWGTASGTYGSFSDVAAPPASIDGLVEGREYFFAVRACDTDTSECSGYSNEVSTVIEGAVVPSAPEAGFSVSPRSGTAPLGVTFANNSSGEIDTYSWSFGDGSSSGAKAPSHTYTEPGTYTVTLTVAGPGGTDEVVMVNAVEVTADAPVAAFAANRTSGTAPLTVQFSNSTSGEADSFLWKFGDSSTSTAFAPQHTYTEPGTYSVSLEATGPGGTTVDYKGSYITVVAGDLAADFTASTTEGPAPLNVQFSSQASGDIRDYLWSFGDGESSTQANPSHTYRTPGTYSVSLTVTARDGSKQSETKTGLIRVSDEETVNGELQIEAGEAEVNDQWRTIALEKRFENPVVLAKSLSVNGNDPAVIQVRNATSDSFDIRLREWAYLDGSHVNESVSYIVVEAGRHTLADGTEIEAGTLQLSPSDLRVPVSFTGAFLEEPVVIATVASANDASQAPVVTRLSSVSAYGFDIDMQKEEAQPRLGAVEEVHYLAWPASSGTAEGYSYVVNATPDAVRHLDYTIDLAQPFEAAPVFLADMQTLDGADTADVRVRSKSGAAVTVFIDEEQSADSETSHTTEVVGFLALSPSGEQPSEPTEPEPGLCDATCTLWDADARPGKITEADSNAVELGMRFRSEVDGYVTGVRFYKGPENVGTHVGSLWTNDGQRLAQATFVSESSSGWQEVTFNAPVAIEANTTYVVSYHTQVGMYSVDAGYFGSARTNGPLTALSSGETGGNGVYRYGSGGFPSQSWQSSNYWVDVMFKTQ